jgi:hypothetical protein
MLQMDPVIRARWTAKLRSNEFIQGTARLSYDDVDDNQRKNCCMGVLCEMAVEDGIVTSENVGGTVFYAHGESRVLPTEVMVWAGLNDTDPPLRRCQEGDQYYRDDSDGIMTCSIANDDEGMNFFQIADLIDGGVDASS